MQLRNQVQLITYPDSLGNNLSDLRQILNNELAGLFSGVHVLPFYPSSGDRGFAPLTHLQIDSAFGNWDDVKQIAQNYDLSADLILNHISKDSEYFKDFLANGTESEYYDMFALPERLGIDKSNDPDILAKIYRPRPSSPLKTISFQNGSQALVWCTFSDEQIDLDWESPQTRDLIYSFIRNLAENGVKMIRLDGVGYMAKQLGTSSFMIPETYRLIKEVQDFAHQLGLIVLCEVHDNFETQLKLSKTADFVYDFALPVLVLDALYNGNNVHLANWLQICPRNQITTLDTHDGLPIPDVKDLIDPVRLQQTLEMLRKNGGNALMRATGVNADNLDIYQINCTYYSALGQNDEAYLLARAIQFFTPGIPQIYYVGLLAGSNDSTLVEKTNVGRDINRHYYSRDEINQEIQRPVVKSLFDLIKLRNQCSIFGDPDAAFSVQTPSESELVLSWYGNSGECTLLADLRSKHFQIFWEEGGVKKIYTTHSQNWQEIKEKV